MAPAKTPLRLKQTQEALAQLWTDSERRRQFSASAAGKSADYGQLSGLSKSGIELYAELLQNNAEGLMSSIFPACRRLLCESAWTETIEAYLRACPPATFHLNSLAREFSAYLKNHERDAEFADWPFMAELADFEWVELEVEEHPAKLPPAVFTALTSQAVIATMVPVLNSTCIGRDYNFLVHEIARTILADADGQGQSLPSISRAAAAQVLGSQYKKPIHLVFFRDPVLHNCRTLELGSAAVIILQQAVSGNHTYAELLQSALNGTAPDALEEMLEKALAVLALFHEVGLFVGNFKR